MIIVSTSVIVVKDTRVLLVKERKDIAKNKYGLPGGKLEHNETLAEGAERECLEETGLTVTASRLIAVTHKPFTREKNAVVRFIFLADLLSIPAENPELDYEWVNEATFRTLVAESRIRGQDVVDIVKRVYKGQIYDIPLPDLYIDK